MSRYNWHSAGSLGWLLLWFEITEMLTAVLKNKFNVSIYYNFRQTLVPYGYSRGSHITRALVEHTLCLQPVKPIAVYMYVYGWG